MVSRQYGGTVFSRDTTSQLGERKISSLLFKMIEIGKKGILRRNKQMKEKGYIYFIDNTTYEAITSRPDISRNASAQRDVESAIMLTL